MSPGRLQTIAKNLLEYGFFKMIMNPVILDDKNSEGAF